MSNSLPSFSSIDLEEFPKQLERLLKTNLERIDGLLSSHTQFDWDNLMRPLEEMDDALERLWSPLSHLHSVMNSQPLRDCYQACLPKLSAYESKVGHNQALYNAVKSLDKSALNATQVKIVEDALRDFELAGVALSQEKKARFEAISARLSQLSSQFENNILDAVHHYQLPILDEARLDGLPAHTKAHAKTKAQELNLPGWVLTLDAPCYLAVMTYANDRALRQEYYYAYVTRASEIGPSAGQYDNTPIMNEILALRHEEAQMLGFANFAALSIATKMAQSTKQVRDFLLDLSRRAHPQALKEYQLLQVFAKTTYGWADIQPWDIAFLSEKKMQQEYAISQEELRPYFPLTKVLDGLFEIVRRLYGMHFERVDGMDVWHPDVRCYAIFDESKTQRGFVYLDLFARSHKRGGAWMDACQGRRRLSNNQVQLPIATLTCNFTAPMKGKEATLIHDEVLTLFHEFGHCLQHVLTQVDYLGASGINGVEWDAVELPSQFFENWCWEEQALGLLTQHIETKVPLPRDLFNKLLAIKNFHSAMAMIRQLEFSLFDFRMHEEYDGQNHSFIEDVLKDVREQVAVVPIATYNRFQHSFSHIFAGGYAAGYYSYKWAEVLSSDAFSRFEEEGIFNENTGRDFLHYILETGGAIKAADAFVNFRKRAPKVDALLKHNGIINNE